MQVGPCCVLCELSVIRHESHRHTGHTLCQKTKHPITLHYNINCAYHWNKHHLLSLLTYLDHNKQPVTAVDLGKTTIVKWCGLSTSIAVRCFAQFLVILVGFLRTQISSDPKHMANSHKP